MSEHMLPKGYKMQRVQIIIVFVDVSKRIVGAFVDNWYKRSCCVTFWIQGTHCDERQV